MQPPSLAAIFLILVGTQGALTIEIDPDVEFLELTTGANFEVKCTGEEELRWEYPPSVLADEKTSSKTVKKYQSSEGMYHADLNIKRAHYMDTGFYNCSNENYTEERQLYLYVRDATHLLAVKQSDEYIFISHPQFQDLIIPCIPTSLDVNVTLTKDEEPMEEVIFDRQKGFIIKEPTMADSGYYLCVASRKYIEQNVMFHVSVYSTNERVSKPIISINGYEGKHIVAGQDITIECHVVEELGVQVSMDWDTPENVDLEKVTYSTMTSHKVTVKGIVKLRNSKNLSIKNVSQQDQGTYVCRVTDQSGNSNEEEFKLEVFSEDMKFLNLSMEGKSEIQVRVSEREAQWIVNIDAYPVLVSKKWFGPNGAQLHDGSDKYSITFEETKTKVTVHNISIEDSGIYRLYANNALKHTSFNVTLLVEDKPKVTLKPKNYQKKYFDINKEIVIDCNVTGYPLPVVTWTFTECTDIKTFCAPGYRIANITMDATSLQNRDFVKWHSQAKWYARDSGIIRCKAENYFGIGEDYINFKVSDVDNGFDLWGPKHRVLSSDSIVIGCGASVYEYESDFQWIYKGLDDSKPFVITNSSRKGISITTNVTSFSYQTFLHLNKVSTENSGSFSCRVKSFLDGEYKEKEFKLLVQGRMPPVFTNGTNLYVNGSQTYRNIGQPVNFTCMVYAVPEAEVIWYKDGKPIVLKENGRIRLENRNQTLIIAYTVAGDTGKYRCTASNDLETSVSRYATLKIRQPGAPPTLWTYTTSIFISLLVAVILLIIALTWSIQRTKKEKDKRKSIGLDPYIYKGDNVPFDPNIDITEYADLLPYDKKWEFPRKKLKLTGTQLGFGAFGVVVKGEATGLPDSDKPVVVAVKMVKQSADFSHVKALVDELKIMGNLGQHLNVVNLLGACTANAHKKELLVIVEYCKYGNLHKYLINHRKTFINQINDNGIVDFSFRSPSHEITYVNASHLTTTGTNEDSNGLSVQTDMTSLSTPVGEDGYLMNVDMISNYQGDYKMNSTQYISTKDLFCWGYQVAKGMEYLASRRVVHGDLAARNVLLAEDNIVKISDFGLAKKLYYKDNYENKKRNVPLPVKWMSIEAIQDGIFSTQSDIWSFGVFLWELFSLGATPYPGLVGEAFFNSLVSGERMKKPAYANNDVYNLMLECWKEQPMLRPLFTECADRLGSLLGETVKQDYVELNNPYMQKNAKISAENDYLRKLNEPSYENVINSGMPEDSLDYVPMKATKTDALNDMELRPMITPGCISYLNPGYQDMNNFKERKYSNVPHNLHQMGSDHDSDHDQDTDPEIQPSQDPESDHAEFNV